MSATEFSTAMKAPGTVVLDVRTPAEFAAGHLPEAKNIDIEGPDFASGIAALDKTATYAVYCRSGNRSATAMEQMTAASFTHVYDLAEWDRRLAEHGRANDNGRSLTYVTRAKSHLTMTGRPGRRP